MDVDVGVGRARLRRDLSRFPSRAGEVARREAREWVEGFLGSLAIVCGEWSEEE